jgi:RNA polymerase sigma-70 factor (ECF subfamily)
VRTNLDTTDIAEAALPLDLDLGFEQHRAELTGHCYRMLGSAFEAEDAVQETLVRAWRSFDRFEGRAALRSWLYRIATNVCLNMLDGRQRRARPIDLGPSSPAGTSLGPARPEDTWIEPIPDGRVVPANGDPAEQAVARETIRLAFVAALQHLPPRQRAVLILRDVLRWKASEVAKLLDTTVVSVHSMLRRARARLAASDLAGARSSSKPATLDDAEQALLARYVDAFERYDVESLIALLDEDATMSMPPYGLWLHGPSEIRRWWIGEGAACCRRARLVPTRANGGLAVGLYQPTGPDGRYEPFAIQVVEAAAGRISGIHSFLDPNLFPLFDLPANPPSR